MLNTRGEVSRGWMSLLVIILILMMTSTSAHSLNIGDIVTIAGGQVYSGPRISDNSLRW
jgi:hypothetical protein